MKVVDQFPYRVREIENLWIPLSDGSRLAARLWLPENAENDPVPAILEYIPYRKRFGTAARDAMHMVLKPNAEFQSLGYTDLEYDLVRLTTPLAPCPAVD